MRALNRMFCQLSHSTTPPQKPCLYFPHNCCSLSDTFERSCRNTPRFVDRIALLSANALFWDEHVCWANLLSHFRRRIMIGCAGRRPGGACDRANWFGFRCKMCKFCNSLLCPLRRWVVPKPTADWYPPTDNYESRESFSCHFFFVSV